MIYRSALPSINSSARRRCYSTALARGSNQKEDCCGRSPARVRPRSSVVPGSDSRAVLPARPETAQSESRMLVPGPRPDAPVAVTFEILHVRAMAHDGLACPSFSRQSEISKRICGHSALLREARRSTAEVGKCWRPTLKFGRISGLQMLDAPFIRSVAKDLSIWSKRWMQRRRTLVPRRYGQRELISEEQGCPRPREPM